MPQPNASGRVPIAVLVALVVAIGTAGALLLPGLLNRMPAPPWASGEAEVCLEVPPPGLDADGTIRLTAKAPERDDLDIGCVFGQGADAASVLEGLEAEVARTGWECHRAVGEGAAPCLRFPGASRIGGSPGPTGLALSFGVSVAPTRSVRLELACRGRGDPPANSGWTIRVGLTAWGPVEAAGGESTAHGTLAEIPFADPQWVRLALADRLRGEGWEVDWGGEDLHLAALPDGSAIGSALLTVAYVSGEGAAPRPPATYHWGLGIVRSD